MPTAAFIAARKIMLATLEAAHVKWKDEVVNPAITQLNLATPTDAGLVPLATILTDAVLKINLYHPELTRLIAETNAMVPSDPPVTPEGLLFSVSPATVTVGQSLTVTWSGIANPTPLDWIALCRPEFTDAQHYEWVYTSGSTTPDIAHASGSIQFLIPERVAGAYELRLLANDTHTVLARAPFTLASVNTPPVEPPPVVVPPPTVDLPVAVTGSIQVVPCFDPPAWAAGMKHVTPAFHPPSGRIYFNNGDYRGWDTQRDMSYQQGTGSFDAANIAAGAKLEYPYAGFGGTTVQPKHPDFCAFPWDDSRKVFWFVPGQQMSSNECAPGETPTGNNDPNFLFGDVFQFDPAKPIEQRWKAMGCGTGPDPNETWMSIYDPIEDTLTRTGYNGGSGSVLNTLDCKTLKWLPRSPIGDGTLRINKEYLAPDLEGRKFYAVDGINGKVVAISLNDHSVEDCGPSPGGKLAYENYTYLVFNSKHRLLEFQSVNESVIYVANADQRPLVWRVGVTNVKARMAVYDPKNDLSLWCGGLEPGNPNILIYKAALEAGTVLP